MFYVCHTAYVYCLPCENKNSLKNKNENGVFACVFAPSLVYRLKYIYILLSYLHALFRVSVIDIDDPPKIEQKNIFFIENSTPKDGATTPFWKSKASCSTVILRRYKIILYICVHKTNKYGRSTHICRRGTNPRTNRVS